MVRFLPLAAVSGALLLAPFAYGQTNDIANYPSGIIKIIVSVPAGGGVDTAARLVAEQLRLQFGQTVVIENRGGQAGNLAAETVYAAEPDGYTLLASQPSPLTVNALIYKKLNFDPTGLKPVAIMTTIPNTLTVRADFPAKTAQEFIAYAKAHPGKLNYGSQGTGTTSYLTAELFNHKTDADLVHVPYKGTAPAINDLIAGHIDLMFAEMASALKLHEAGKARILAVTTRHRSPLLPNVPTLIEAGIPDFESSTWNAISAPPKTPNAIIKKLNAAIVAGLTSPEVASHLRKISMIPAAMDPKEASEFIKADMQRWAKVIRSAGIAPQD